MEWKWTKGEPYERSKRLKDIQELENKQFSKEIEQGAYTSSLHHDENTWEILNQSVAGNSGFKVSNKREELDHKISDRDLVQQRGFNPFLNENNYVNDVSVRDQFLKPVNTTQGATRNKESDYS
jgi:hypothetical protein